MLLSYFPLHHILKFGNITWIIGGLSNSRVGTVTPLFTWCNVAAAFHSSCNNSVWYFVILLNICDLIAIVINIC